MTETWLLAAAILLAGLVPCAVVCTRDDAADGVAALQAGLAILGGAFAATLPG
jgi:hypothetical protein